ncbi:hypothetical protein CR194_03075 [Salipaludibacillus keqinensis]|uniref:Sporulation protein YpjB n=1 Tax=Salipaludibacillus keqinensis TaxID=2045207 RepID=A0A323THZ9_9BACI|nr:sporulation protein YpjB [Salipaludibacillus keqinensis]PYZ94531.1 hypothetical protein CR194_03075 [Salipaludibacillus keqinensis]
MGKEKRGWLLIVTILFALLIAASTVNSASEERWTELNHTSDTILQYVKQQHYQEASDLLDTFAQEFLQTNANELGLTMRELQILTETFDEAVYAVTNTALTHNQRVSLVYKLRLLTDVYVHSEEPLWHNMKTSLLTSLKQMQPEDKSNLEVSHEDINEFIAYYDTVKPAWSVALSQEQFQRIHSQVQYLLQMRNQNVSLQEWSQHLERIEQELFHIFDGVDEDEVTDPSFYWLIITVSSAIFSSLSYVGWKKYKGHKTDLLRMKDRGRS